jgi:hypothetical protein
LRTNRPLSNENANPKTLAANKFHLTRFFVSELAYESSALLLSAGQFGLIAPSLEQTGILAKSDTALLRANAN